MALDEELFSSEISIYPNSDVDHRIRSADILLNVVIIIPNVDICSHTVSRELVASMEFITSPLKPSKKAVRFLLIRTDDPPIAPPPSGHWLILLYTRYNRSRSLKSASTYERSKCENVPT